MNSLALNGQHWDYPAPSPPQQRAAKQAFEAPHLHAQRRLRAARDLGRAAQAPLPAHGGVGAQQVEIDRGRYHLA